MTDGPAGFHVRTLGCKVNRAESDELLAALLGLGARPVPAEDARVVVVNTCTVTGEADAKARKAVRGALALAQEPLVIVTGCLATLDAEALRALGERVVVEPDKDAVRSRVSDALGLGPVAGATDEASDEEIRYGPAFRTRVSLKAQDGCDAFCAYCIVPYARGVPGSVPVERAVAQAARLVRAGASEIVLTGVNLGRYADGAVDLAELVERVAATGVTRLRLSSIEPLDVTDRLLEVLAQTESFCPHLHVPLQSGSDDVLRAMRRGYSSREYLERVSAARDVLPGLAVTTDVLAGFPGETDDDAAATEALARGVGFSRLHVFRYSARPGTAAADLPRQVDPAVRAERAARLRALDEALRREFVDVHDGRVAEVLIEDACDEYGEGTTRHYLKVRVAGTYGPGDLVMATLAVTERGDVVGEPLGGPAGARSRTS